MPFWLMRMRCAEQVASTSCASAGREHAHAPRVPSCLQLHRPKSHRRHHFPSVEALRPAGVRFVFGGAGVLQGMPRPCREEAAMPAPD